MRALIGPQQAYIWLPTWHEQVIQKCLYFQKMQISGDIEM